MATRTRGTQICQGYTKTGQKCTRRLGVTNTTGFCRPEHRDNLRTNHQDSPKGAAVLDQVKTIGHGVQRGSTVRLAPVSEQGAEYGNLYSQVDPELFTPLDRDEIPQRDADNWANPEVRSIASRLGVMSRQVKMNDEVAKSMQDLLEQRTLRHLRETTGSPVGEWELEDSRGRPAGKMVSEFKEGNYSEKQFLKSVVPSDMPEGGEDYSVRVLDASAMRKSHKEAWEKMRKPSGKSKVEVNNSTETDEALHDRLMERYEGKPVDPDTLKNWNTAALAHEVTRIRNENQLLRGQMERDADDLRYALPEDSYEVANPDTGFSTTVSLSEPTKRFERKLFDSLDAETQEKIRGDEKAWKRAFTSASVRRGDKKYGSDFYARGRNPGSIRAGMQSIVF